MLVLLVVLGFHLGLAQELRSTRVSSLGLQAAYKPRFCTPSLLNDFHPPCFFHFNLLKYDELKPWPRLSEMDHLKYGLVLLHHSRN